MKEISRARKLYERIQKMLESEPQGDFYLYAVYEERMEDATLLKVVERNGNNVKFQWLETDVDSQDCYTPTGELEKDGVFTGKLGKTDSEWEYIQSDALGQWRAFKINKPVKWTDGSEQGKCDDLDIRQVTPYRRATYFDPAEGGDMEFSCTANKRKACNIDLCPKGPIYFMTYGATEKFVEDVDYTDNDLWDQRDSGTDEYRERNGY